MQQIKDLYNSTPVRHLESLGILDRETVCVHCNWLDDEERDILADRGARVVTCPASNMKLASGIAPVPEMLADNITIGLGTDGCASNNRLDLFREMDLLAKMHKVHQQDPTTVPARQALKIATRGGAKILSQQDRIGSLSKGSCADLILLDLRQPHLLPFYNQDLLVYGASGADVHTVIINGRLIMDKKKILSFDEEETMRRVSGLVAELQNSR